MPGHVAATPSHLPQGCAPIPLLRNQDPSAPWIASIAVPDLTEGWLEDLRALGVVFGWGRRWHEVDAAHTTLKVDASKK